MLITSSTPHESAQRAYRLNFRAGVFISVRIFDDEVKRAVRIEKQLRLFKRGERPVALIYGGINEHARRQIALGRPQSAFQDVQGVSAGRVIVPWLPEAFREFDDGRD